MHSTPSDETLPVVHHGVSATASEHSAAGLPVQSAQSETGLTSSDVQQALLPKATYQHPISPWRRQYTVVLVAVIAALLSADQNLLAPNLSAAAAYFGLDDVQKDTYLGGYLMAAFFLVGAPAALLCGYFADKFNRIHMLAFIVVVGEAPCLCTYWVTELWQFFLVRMLTGISVGGCFPLVFSLLGDLFPVSQRAAMSSIVQIAIGGGIGGGQMVAGLLGPATNWRLPFLVMAAPTLLLAFLLLATVKEPPRGGFEKALESQFAAGAEYSESITWSKMWSTLRVPSNWIIVLQGIFGCLPWGVMQTYLTDYLHQQRGLSIQLATTVILLFGVGSAVGVIAGGAAGQALYNWRRPTMAVLTGVSVVIGAAPVLWLINADMQEAGFGVALFMAALAGCFASIAGPNLRAIMINVNAPETRGVALALQSVTDDLGKGLGPVIVAGFISRLGRTGAFNLSICGWFPCGVLLTSLACTMTHDEDAMQERLAQRSAQVLHSVQVDSSSSCDGPGSSSSGGNSISGGSTPSPGFEPGSAGLQRGASPWQGKLHLPPALTRPFGRARGGRVAPGGGSSVSAELVPVGSEGVKGVSAAAALAACPVSVQAGGRVMVSVLAEAEGGGSVVEMRQLLGELAGSPSSSRHCQQQLGCSQQHTEHGILVQQPQQGGRVFVLEDCQDVASAAWQQSLQQEGPQQQQQQQAQPLGLQQPSQHAGSSSKDDILEFQQTCIDMYSDNTALVAAASSALSAHGTRHRTGHGHRSRGSGGHGSGSSCGSGSCGMALGEGAEEGGQGCSTGGVGWQWSGGSGVVMGGQEVWVAS